ncbi:hypothetical protein BKA69DRAFT_1124973 [Paraphysoderma sedebokerense]|nr:hypothetical protein BKA69DRAFT_1124973 [Paraphysoderma sedebokerense]
MGAVLSICCPQCFPKDDDQQPLLSSYDENQGQGISNIGHAYSQIQEQEALKKIVGRAGETFIDITSTNPGAIERMCQHSFSSPTSTNYSTVATSNSTFYCHPKYKLLVSGFDVSKKVFEFDIERLIEQSTETGALETEQELVLPPLM